MPKPIFLVTRPIIDDAMEFDAYERMVVKLQEQMSDYHVICIPKLNAADMSVKVLSTENVYEYDVLGAKELIMNAVKKYLDDGNKKLAREI